MASRDDMTVPFVAALIVSIGILAVILWSNAQSNDQIDPTYRISEEDECVIGGYTVVLDDGMTWIRVEYSNGNKLFPIEAGLKLTDGTSTIGASVHSIAILWFQVPQGSTGWYILQ